MYFQQQQEKTVETLCSIKASGAGAELHVEARGWLEGATGSSYRAWRQSLPTKSEYIHSSIAIQKQILY